MPLIPAVHDADAAQADFLRPVRSASELQRKLTLQHKKPCDVHCISTLSL